MRLFLVLPRTHLQRRDVSPPRNSKTLYQIHSFSQYMISSEDLQYLWQSVISVDRKCKVRCRFTINTCGLDTLLNEEVLCLSLDYKLLKIECIQSAQNTYFKLRSMWNKL